MMDAEPLFDLPAPAASGSAAGEHAASSEEAAREFERMAAAPLAELVHPEWAVALAPCEPTLRAALSALARQAHDGAVILPAPARLLRAFARPLHEVKVIVIGQDPYPTPGHAIGLSFACDAHVRPLPRSLANIYRELSADLGVPAPSDGDLSPWADEGVLLLNRVLSVRAGAAGSHRRLGWEEVTDAAVWAVVARGAPLVAILWGRDAQSVAPLLGATPTIASAHPSPLSASRGFFGSRPFSRANELLAQQGAAPVRWA
ncbi:uracil-DNA glycosylase [Sinomonas sp. R1AF57]|uniref:uracil-DNA glycosylase n=1 Tax=Sinomonas sp. R1AF57 TaxID=2020377 RepID=UPI000B616F1F|nr:uracil-DNA glycosylase [Sinomonas sp. R1AF57]